MANMAWLLQAHAAHYLAEGQETGQREGAGIALQKLHVIMEGRQAGTGLQKRPALAGPGMRWHSVVSFTCGESMWLVLICSSTRAPGPPPGIIILQHQPSRAGLPGPVFLQGHLSCPLLTKLNTLPACKGETLHSLAPVSPSRAKKRGFQVERQ